MSRPLNLTGCFECQYSEVVWYHGTDLPTPVAALVEAHIDDCLACRTEVAGEQAVARLVQRVVPVQAAPADLRLRIKAQIVALSFDSRPTME